MAKETEVKTENVGGLVRDYLKEQAEKSIKNRQTGGEDVKISLTNKTPVRFTRDFGKHLKAGDEMELSDMAVAIYEKAGVIEKK